ncbi:MAG: hypothetical protein Q8J78_09485 [Moraxellaceae bacterium]|nr:hypothetical protein [Moraxellaceae bacterium]
MLLVLYLLALLAICTATLSAPALMLALLLWCLLAMRERRLWRAGSSVIAFQERAGDWWLQWRDGCAGAMRLERAMAWRYLVVMDFSRSEGLGELPRRQRIVLFPDSLPADDFRRVRVRLLKGPPPGKVLRG